MIPVLVISLKEETQRRTAIAEHLSSLGFEYQILDAIDARGSLPADHPDYDSAYRLATHGRDLKAGEIGCFLSHRMAYQEMIEQNLPYALIVEDDMRFNKDAANVLQSLLDKNLDFDVIRLLDKDKILKNSHRKITQLAGDYWLLRLRALYGGAYATLISRKGAEKLVKATKTFALPVDTVLGRCWETGINSFAIQPTIATHIYEFESSIGEERFNKDTGLKGLQKLKYALNRFIFKLYENIAKTWLYYANAPKDLANRKKLG